MPRLSEFAVNEGCSRDGVWVRVGERFYMRVARYGNPEHLEEIAAVRRPHAQAIARGAAPDIQFDRLAGAVLVKGWGAEANGQLDSAGKTITDAEDLLDDDGSPIPCTPENVRRVLTSECHPQFWETVSVVARTDAFFREEILQAIAGNSRNSSGGKPHSEET